MGKRAKRKPSSKYQDSDKVVQFSPQNSATMRDGPRRKNWSLHDLRPINPMTQKQEDMFQSWFQGDNVCAHGSAGTGKTFLAFYLALNEFLQYGEHQQIIVVRSAVAGREIGHLPGTKEEKESVFELPYMDICNDLMGRKSTYDDMKEAGKIKFMTTSHIRGLTWDNSIIIIDEAQNLSFDEIDSVITRMGKNSRVIVCGDHKKQCDLKHYETTGIGRLIAAFDVMKTFSNIEYTYADVVRSPLVKEWLMATDQV